MIHPNLLQRAIAADIIAERDRLAQALRDLIQASDDINKRLNDPNDDDGKTGTKPPDGDDFNELDATLCGIAQEALK